MQLSTGWTRRMLTIALALVALLPQAAGAEPLQGVYRGIGQGEGATIEIAPDDEGYAGTWTGRDGIGQPFKADRVGDAAEAVIDHRGGPAILRVTPMMGGARIDLIPVDGQGRLRLDQAEVLAFQGRNGQLPRAPEGFVEPPPTPIGVLAADSFLASWEFWPPEGVRNGYMRLSDRSRTLIRLFPAVQLDVIWKLCAAPAAGEALSIALRGQGVNCEEVSTGIASARAQGRFPAYKDAVAKMRDILRLQMQCADGYVRAKRECDAASKAVARAAVSLETAGTVLARFR